MEAKYINETPRMIELLSDDGQYKIKARLIAEQDGYGEFATYRGSSWIYSMYKNGKRVDYIPFEYAETPTCKISGLLNFKPYSEFCPRRMTLCKNTIIYGASVSHLFTKALEGKDIKAAVKKWTKDYLNMRIAEEEERISKGL